MLNLNTLERMNKKTHQTRMLIGPKQRVHSGRIQYLTIVTDPILRKVLTMYRLSEHRLAIEKGRPVDRPGSQEKTGYVLTAHKMRWKLSCTS